jgi:hypothetical protein
LSFPRDVGPRRSAMIKFVSLTFDIKIEGIEKNTC